jgi:hypothetical protein
MNKISKILNLFKETNIDRLDQTVSKFITRVNTVFKNMRISNPLRR